MFVYEKEVALSGQNAGRDYGFEDKTEYYEISNESQIDALWADDITAEVWKEGNVTLIRTNETYDYSEMIRFVVSHNPLTKQQLEEYATKYHIQSNILS